MSCIDVNPNPLGLVYMAHIDELWGWDNTNFRWMLLKSPFLPDRATQEFVDDISTNEFTDGSYSRVTTTGTGGPTGTDSLSWTASDVAFGSVAGTETANYLVLFLQVTNDADSPLLVAYRIDRTADSTAFTIKWGNSGQCLGVQQVFSDTQAPAVANGS